jgi:DNA polymerase III alpha subunit (gram-positive type)
VSGAENAVKKMEQVRVDYKKKLTEAASDSFMRERVNEWVMDSCDRITRDNRDHA